MDNIRKKMNKNKLKILYFNCASGISGDMVVGALLDLGIVKQQFLTNELKKLNLKNFNVKIKNVNKSGVKATKFDVMAKPEHEHRHLNGIYKIIDDSNLDAGVKKLSKRIFLNLAKAEAKVHETSIDEVHFHEVGAVDSIIDIVSASILLEKIKPDKVFCGRISEGRGKVKFSHGTTELPVPAVRELLKDCPLQVLDMNTELVTPTGAAILKTILDDFRSKESFKVITKGFGAGTKSLKHANVLEIDVVEMKSKKKGPRTILLETNIDDMNPEIYQYVIDKLLSEGAVEAFIQPIIMKKSRIGILLSVICDEKIKDKMIEMIFDETTTFGIRINQLERAMLDRESKTMKMPFGEVRIKIGKFNGKPRSIKPEYEDCKKIAVRKNIPLKKVYDQVLKRIKD